MPGEQFASWVNSGNATENEKLDSAAFRAGSISLTTKEEINEQETRRSGGDEKCLSKRMIFFSSCLGVSVFLLALSSRFDESLGLKKAHTQYRRAIFYMVSLASSRRNRRYFQDFIGAIMVTACHTGKS